MSKSSSVLCVAVAAVVACTFPASAEDITAAVRAAGKGTASLTDGFEPYYSNQPASKAFDGNHVEEAGRLLIKQTGTQQGQEVWVRYDIADDFQPGMDIVVESFTFWYSICGGDQPRTPTWMRLEASVTGDDGDWIVLAKNDEIKSPFVWENRTDHFYTVAVPVVRQKSYRHYRFVSSKAASILTIHELVLNGQIVTPLTDLTWNGGAGGTWDATEENWMNSDGNDVAWVPAARANIGETAPAVSGELLVGEMRFTGETAPTVSGPGTLKFDNPARIGVAADGAMNASVVDSFYGEDTADSCAEGTRTTDYTYLPRQSDSVKNTGRAVVWWKNRRLADIVGFKNATIYYNGNRPAAPHKFVNNGSTASVQFQGVNAYSGTRGGPGNWAELGAKVEFAQVGPDITARLVCAGFVWSQDFLKKEGCWDEATETVDLDKHSPGHNIYDDSLDGVAGFKGLLAITSWNRGLMVLDRREPAEVVLTGRLVPDVATEGKTSVRVLYAKNLKLSDIVDFSGATLHYTTDDGSMALPYNVKRTASAINVQYQRMYSSTAIICVKAEFTEEDGDVYVQGMYAKYKNSVTAADLGFDFDYQTGGGITTIYGTASDGKTFYSAGYSLSKILLPTVKNLSYAFNGAFNVVGKVRTDRVDFAFGGTVAVSSADTFAETPLALTDGAALSVAAGIAAVTPKLTVTGAATLTFADGASLEADDIDLSAAETVTVVAAEGAKWMKVGRALTKDELKKFAPGDGFRAKQDADGWLFAERKTGIILIVR